MNRRHTWRCSLKLCSFIGYLSFAIPISPFAFWLPGSQEAWTIVHCTMHDVPPQHKFKGSGQLTMAWNL